MMATIMRVSITVVTITAGKAESRLASPELVAFSVTMNSFTTIKYTDVLTAICRQIYSVT